MNKTRPTIRVAAVQASSVFLDKYQSIEKACTLVRKAASQGAQLIAFPEGFIPGHPVWYHFHAATSSTSLALATSLQQNSVVLAGQEVDILRDVARETSSYLVIGICEKESQESATLYNGQLFIDRDGEILGVHRKLTPTLGERLVHAGGFGDTLRCFETEFGKVGGLICGENSNPLALSALTGMGVDILVASWPPHFSRVTHRMADVIEMTARYASYSAGCSVLGVAGVADAQLEEAVALTEEDHQFFEAGAGGGGSLIVSPKTRILTGPMPPAQEGIIYADVDLNETTQARLIHDYAGHYNRRDVFTLHLKRSAPPLLLIDEKLEPSLPRAHFPEDEGFHSCRPNSISDTVETSIQTDSSTLGTQRRVYEDNNEAGSKSER